MLEIAQYINRDRVKNQLTKFIHLYIYYYYFNTSAKDKFEFNIYYNLTIKMFEYYYSIEQKNLQETQRKYFQNINKVDEIDKLQQEEQQQEQQEDTKSIAETNSDAISDDEEFIEFTYYYMIDEIVKKYDINILENNLLTAYEIYKLYYHFIDTFYQK